MKGVRFQGAALAAYALAKSRGQKRFDNAQKAASKLGVDPDNQRQARNPQPKVVKSTDPVLVPPRAAVVQQAAPAVPAPAPGAAPAAAIDPKVITLDDRGTIEVAKNQPLYVQLAGNPSTGQSWKVKSVDRMLGAPAHRIVLASGHVGGSGFPQDTRFVWDTTSAALVPGSTHAITFEKTFRGQEVIGTFSVNVKIV